MTATLPILDSQGQQVSTVDLLPTWLEHEKGEQAVHDSVVAFLAKRRAGTASTKRRGEVSGGGRKPWRQKGTGRARAGSIRSPVWRGGGITFGPHPRSFAKQINKKVQRLALRRVFTERVAEGAVIVVEDVLVAEPKTKRMVEFLNAVKAGDDVLVLVETPAPPVSLAARNLPGVLVMKVASVNSYWMLLFKKIVITRAALAVLGSHLCAQEKAR